MAFLSVMQYYQPAKILSTGLFPWQDGLVLLAVAATTWLLGCEIFARRNVCTCSVGHMVEERTPTS